MQIEAQPAASDHGFGYMVVMGFVVAGMSAVDQISGQVLPLTMRHFTDNMFLIGLLIGSLNRMFGFVVQPYVAWKSDQINTKYGRRRPFFLFGAPITLSCLMFLGAMPFIFQGDARKGIVAMLCVYVFNIALQACMDATVGCLDPLYADSFKQKTLGRAASIRHYCGMIVHMTFSLVALRLMDKHEFYPYAFAAVWIVTAWLLMKFIIRENPAPLQKSTKTYNPIGHFGMLKNPAYLKLAIIAAMGLSLPASSNLFQALFITQTLGLSKTEMGLAAGFGPLVAFCVSFPVGYLVDRFGPRYLLSAGFFGIACMNICMAFFVHDFRSLIIVSLVNAGIALFSNVPITSMIFQYAGPKERGTIFGLIQFIRAFSAFSVSLIISVAVQNSRSYDATPIYPLDIKEPAAIAKRITNPQTPFDKYMNEAIPADLLQAIKAAKEKEKLKKPLADALNHVMNGKSIYEPARFEGVELSRQSRKLAEIEQPSEKQMKVFNRGLMQDAFARQLSAKANFRISYMLNIFVAIFAGSLALTTRKGQYAQTIKDN